MKIYHSGGVIAKDDGLLEITQKKCLKKCGANGCGDGFYLFNLNYILQMPQRNWERKSPSHFKTHSLFENTMAPNNMQFDHDGPGKTVFFDGGLKRRVIIFPPKIIICYQQHMRKFLVLAGFLLAIFPIFAQQNKSSTSAVYEGIQKLAVFGKVLYIAAHPDDENTRLLAYLANERKLETAYLSLTRGDGGQNLIGDEQGIDLGLVRTQELLAARKIDGAQQFFTTAFDFGYSKSPEEALAIWGQDQILADVVWIIRKFKPDVIITRFPTTGEGGHGHHTASAILAVEAFDAAADSTKFPEQLQYVKIWKAKRLMWNTFNFGGNNTTREDQLKLDVGSYNAVLGKSYGEMASESRSQHRSQGFGVPAQRGISYEYFQHLKGEAATKDIMDGINVNSTKVTSVIGYELRPIGDTFGYVGISFNRKIYDETVNKLIGSANFRNPTINVADAKILLEQKTGKPVADLILNSNGIFIEAIASQQINAINDSMPVQFSIINRNGFEITGAVVECLGNKFVFDKIPTNTTVSVSGKLRPNAFNITNPYWLNEQKETGRFMVKLQTDIGPAESPAPMASFILSTAAGKINVLRPLQYKYTDPVKGELYQPVHITYPALINVSPGLKLVTNDAVKEPQYFNFSLQANTNINGVVKFYINALGKRTLIKDTSIVLLRGSSISFNEKLDVSKFLANSNTMVGVEADIPGYNNKISYSINKISYDHIPDIFYHYYDHVSVLKLDLKIAGKKAGYIAGAGDKLAEALTEMGYEVTMLNRNDITAANLQQFDVVVTGVRAYNIHAWLSDKYEVLMKYVENGGVLFNQYNTNSNLGPVKARMAPYPFTIGRNRVTDEKAVVKFLLPDGAAMNYPNVITQKDFDGWVQERSIYEAEAIDDRYEKYFAMKDAGTAETNGSVVVAKYGKGKYIYSGLVFFRELPAAVPGAFRLFANLIARPKN